MPSKTLLWFQFPLLHFQLKFEQHNFQPLGRLPKHWIHLLLLRFSLQSHFKTPHVKGQPWFSCFVLLKVAQAAPLHEYRCILLQKKKLLYLDHEELTWVGETDVGPALIIHFAQQPTFPQNKLVSLAQLALADRAAEAVEVKDALGGPHDELAGRDLLQAAAARGGKQSANRRQREKGSYLGEWWRQSC